MDTRLHTRAKVARPPSFTPLRGGVLQRKCACGGSAGLASECEECGKQRLSLQSATGSSEIGTRNSDAVPPIVHEVLRSPGQPMEAKSRAYFEPRFGHDFSQVRVHTDVRAAESASAVEALAYTVGRHLVFGVGQYSPETFAGRRLLAHELTHTIQQAPVSRPTFAAPVLAKVGGTNEAEREADNTAAHITDGSRTTITPHSQASPALQRDTFHTPTVSVRSPAVEEAVTQLTEFLPGRSLTRDERALASGIFGTSIDFSRVRLIPTSILEYRTVANSIRVPEDFTILDEAMAQTFIHELTHVWQYQHAGTSYISISLGTQIAAQVRRGNRNFAYDYQINPGQSFFEFTPEQQAFLVENYFAMLRDQAAIPRDQAAGVALTYKSNHLGADGFRAPLTGADRLTEISRELPLHAGPLSQMRAAFPRPEAEILTLRASEVMQTPGQDLVPTPREQQIAPVKPLLEIRF